MLLSTCLGPYPCVWNRTFLEPYLWISNGEIVRRRIIGFQYL